MSGSLPVLAVHLACVFASLAGFLLRGWWMWQDSPLLRQRLTRVLPHVVDSVLLGSGIGLVLVTGLYPWQQPWLAAKLLALVLYIGLGMLALKHARSRARRGAALLGALVTYVYMIGAALRHSPWSWWSL
jgi:uncharacterized membrane protein SirB2